MFSSKSFIVSGLTFRSLIHFEFIFVYSISKCSDFTEFAKVKYYVKEDLLEILLVSYSTQK